MDRRMTETETVKRKKIDVETREFVRSAVFIARRHRRVEQSSRVFIIDGSIVVGMNEKTLQVQLGEKSARLKLKFDRDERFVQEKVEPRLKAEKLKEKISFRAETKEKPCRNDDLLWNDEDWRTQIRGRVRKSFFLEEKKIERFFLFDFRAKNFFLLLNSRRDERRAPRPTIDPRGTVSEFRLSSSQENRTKIERLSSNSSRSSRPSNRRKNENPSRKRQNSIRRGFLHKERRDSPTIFERRKIPFSFDSSNRIQREKIFVFFYRSEPNPWR